MKPDLETERSEEIGRAAVLPLCVDLDGTLVRTDTFVECLLQALKGGPVRFFSALWRLVRSRAAAKKLASGMASLDPALLPYHADFLDYLRAERSRGRRLLLVTGADRSIAEGVAGHLGIFDDVLASDGTRNLTRSTKADAIAAYLDGRPFAYAGNSSADLPVWRRAATAVLVDAPRSYSKIMAAHGKPLEREFPREGQSWRDLLRLVRPKQWAKNILIWAPVFLGHKATSPEVWAPALIAFAAFSLCASALYIWNDLLDIQVDRAHPRKRNRPLASGAVSVQAGMALMAGLLLSAIGLSMLLPVASWGLLIAYAGGSLCYSALLKRMTMVDVVALAAFYTLRIFFGGAATGIQVSVWTMAFSVFLFLSLALIKRLTELRNTATRPNTDIAGRGYRPEDLPILAALAAAAGYLSALVLGLYIQSPEVQLLYRQPRYLWFMMPALVYWISRALVLANRGQMHDDPVLYALKDKASYAALACCAAVVFLAT
jgi:4-hydroxybenzoate polyprenyltransferase